MPKIFLHIVFSCSVGKTFGFYDTTCQIIILNVAFAQLPVSLLMFDDFFLRECSFDIHFSPSVNRVTVRGGSLGQRCWRQLFKDESECGSVNMG